ncbi:FAD-linked oxidase C-terminal domain-containing protein [Alicyclobacillus sp.]|uniref:FAD-binding oxidoreductase n=1 Tax=Alicyclobacillus sp. TaxID=61169 RepID=UPI0025C701E6|nr:FAD-linked oxidase C-terminal domain-containing protein [Alicyclobacillus sp.]MCL6517626.1 FAD-binding protein [Alicyclobacillus sp.]
MGPSHTGDAHPATDLREALLEILPDPGRVTSGASALDQHGRDLSHHAPRRPDVVVFPETAEEVSRILRFANEHRVPVVPFGVGTSLEGHVIPERGGISIDMTRMNRVVEVRPKDFLVRVQPGITRTQLNRHLTPHGLWFPLDPGADATIGGMAATNASGTTAVRYGVMRDQVLDLEVVLADGSIVRTGSMARKSSAGYNLTGLFVGSEGTLGVITELTLKVYGIPEHTVAARAEFPDLYAACQAAYGIIGSGIPIARVELVDEHTVAAVNRFKGTAYPETPALFLEFQGTKAAVEGDVRLAEEICREEGATAFRFETDSAARHELWEARHDAALAILAVRPGSRMKVTDVCVPPSDMPEAIRRARETIDRHGVHGAILGHVGDGNYHVVFAVDPDDEAELAVAERINDEIVRFALERGGTCTGEHGVGWGKMRYVAEERASVLPLMRAVKRAFDPNNILNPGKVFTLS